MSISPAQHGLFLAGAVISALAFAGIILARNPKSTPARMHAIYGGLAAWWFYCMAMIAGAEQPDDVGFWARLAHLSVGLLPGVIYHLNVATAGVSHEHRPGIVVHYGASVVLTLFCLAWPGLFDPPRRFSWGLYPSYTGWGLLVPAAFVVVFAEVMAIYHRAARTAPGTPYAVRIGAFYRGNAVAILAGVDFLPAFGLAVYPFGFAVLTALHAMTVFGSIRFRLIEITAEFAAERILKTLPDAVFVVDTQGLIRLANRAAARAFEFEEGEMVNQPIARAVADPGLLLALRPVGRTPPSVQEVRVGDETDGRFFRLSTKLLLDQKREPVARIWVMHDLTEQRRAEAEKHKLEGWIRHGQKLETLGVMAGGIAHDFNNLLTAILGGAEAAREQLAHGLPADEELRMIEIAVDRAAELTAQMLTYAGRGPTTAGPIDLNALTREMTELLRLAVSKKATLDLQLADRIPTVIADKSQISQILLNLITNASDALGETTGTIKVRTGTLRPSGLPEPDGEPAGEEVFLEVIDTGSGMDRDTKSRMFDPFFSTKFAGRGLGLATVMGIVQSYGGRIRVETELRRGTRVTVALPAAREPRAAIPARSPSPALAGNGIALVADDDLAVRRVACQLLVEGGFEVVEAADGEEAIDVFRDRRAEISLVLLDLTMPKIDGREAYREIRSLSPEVPILLASGYTDLRVDDLATDARAALLNKPFRASALAEAIRRASEPDG